MNTVTIYGKIGESIQYISTSGIAPDGYIEMSGERPEDGDYIAQADGTWVAHIPVPQSVTSRQGKLALLETPHDDATLLDVVETILDNIADPIRARAAQIEYNNATWERDSEFVNEMLVLLGKTVEEGDALFILAAMK